MSHRIRMSLDIACEDDDAAEAELTWLAEYVEERLNHGADCPERGNDDGVLAGIFGNS